MVLILFINLSLGAKFHKMMLINLVIITIMLKNQFLPIAEQEQDQVCYGRYQNLEKDQLMKY